MARRNKEATVEEAVAVSAHVQRKLDARKKDARIEGELVHQFAAGRILARLTSRPGQSGRADGYILEGKELEFYQKKIKARKA